MTYFKYIIMFLIVLGLAFADFVTGYIKARCRDEVSSKALRIGGLHKIAELVIMATAIGLTVGLDMLGRYYDDTRLTDVAGMFTALSVFVYITVMELISILENFAAITPEAKWARKILKRLKNYENEDNKEERSS
ncbi:MAG: phage holin family protein [Ruminococcus sp.]|nr:phage holin family protein [Ruminococcus sp.]